MPAAGMSDYSALAQRVSLSITGVRGCLMLSRDGMILGAHPEGEAESDLRAAWVRFAGVGDPERSYVEFPDQIWAFVRRGAYGAFAVADVGVRPGVLVDMLEQALMAGEQERADDRETMRLPDVPSAPSGKPRSILHRSERSTTAEPEPMIVRSPVSIPVVAAPVPPPASSEAQGTDEPAAGSPEQSEPAVEDDDAAPADDTSETQEGKEDESEVDRILLAKEFAGLLQVPREDDEADK
jgi:hypothetical protein